jgi:hypothetical protein
VLPHRFEPDRSHPRNPGSLPDYAETSKFCANAGPPSGDDYGPTLLLTT